MTEKMQVTVAEGRTSASTWRRLWRRVLSLSKGWLRPIFGLALLAFLLWRVDWQELTRIMRQVSVGYVGAALLIVLIPFVLLLVFERVLPTFAHLEREAEAGEAEAAG